MAGRLPILASYSERSRFRYQSGFSRYLKFSRTRGKDKSGLHGGGNRFLAVLALVLAESLCTSLGSPVQDSLPVLVHLQLDDGDLAGVDTHVGGGAVGFLPLDALNVDPSKQNKKMLNNM